MYLFADIVIAVCIISLAAPTCSVCSASGSGEPSPRVVLAFTDITSRREVENFFVRARALILLVSRLPFNSVS